MWFYFAVFVVLLGIPVIAGMLGMLEVVLGFIADRLDVRDDGDDP